MDPDDAEVGTDDPWATIAPEPTYPQLKGDDLLYIEGGDPFDYSGGCTSFGMPISCSAARSFLARGLGQINGIDVSGPTSRGPQTSLSSPMLVLEDLIQTTHVWMTGEDGEWRTYHDAVIKAVNLPNVRPNLQNPIRDVMPILNQIRFLGSNANNSNLQSMLQVRLMQLLSKGCAAAFRRAGLATPEEIINKGITIADRPLLDDSSNNETLGLSETTRHAFARSQAPALTIRSQFTSKGPIIFIRAEAYADTDYLDEAIAHEFIHAAGVGQFPLWGYRFGRGNDLSGYEHYKDIIDNCGYKNVFH
jgi:hypothetical protein